MGQTSEPFSLSENRVFPIPPHAPMVDHHFSIVSLIKTGCFWMVNDPQSSPTGRWEELNGASFEGRNAKAEVIDEEPVFGAVCWGILPTPVDGSWMCRIYGSYRKRHCR
jgi:hypothetical protein